MVVTPDWWKPEIWLREGMNPTTRRPCEEEGEERRDSSDEEGSTGGRGKGGYEEEEEDEKEDERKKIKADKGVGVEVKKIQSSSSSFPSHLQLT